MNEIPQTPEAIFGEAIEISSPQDRSLFLDRVCAENADLRREVERLVEDHFRAGSFLEAPAFGEQPTAVLRPIAEQPGAVIGPYKLLQQIGEGGMGVVFMAEQTEPLQRTVALKIIKPGMDTRQVIARFDAERQAVAMMDHPNIAKVLDAGATDSGRPYFVMELVKGIPITKYCDDKQLPVRARLELFTQVCQAVQHAHQKGIIHRDIKPNNVLVAEYDSQAVPKVIDFGVAKATAHRLTDRTMFTEFGQVLGTMEYMSPEQAKFNQLDVDTRSDVYSLGVMLYELLAGSTPFEGKRLKDAAFDEMLRIIREEEPPKPSTRLSSIDTLPSVAANRHTEPARLSKDVQGELDWIVMKALEKDRNRRYETASGFAADIERHLRDQPVEAGPPSAVYRLRKLARRHKMAFMAAGAATALVVAAVVLLTVTSLRIRQASAAKDAALATAREAVDQMLTRVADETLLNVPQAEPIRKSLLDDALRFYEGFMRQAGTDPSIRLEAANVLRRISNIQHDLGRGHDARHSMERCVGLLQSLVDSDPTEPTYREQLADAHMFLAYTINVGPSSGQYTDSEAHVREALRLYAALQNDFPDRPQSVGNATKTLGDLMLSRRNVDEAERLYRQAIIELESHVKYAPTAGTWMNLHYARQTLVVAILDNPGPRFDPVESERVFKEALDATDQALKFAPKSIRIRWARAATMKELGQLYQVTGQADDAISLLREALPELQEICAQSPWEHGIWSNLRDTQATLINQLASSGRTSELKQLDHDIYEWLHSFVPRIPLESEPLMEVSTMLLQHITRLTSSGQERKASELARTAVDLGRHIARVLPSSTDSRLASAKLRVLNCSLILLGEDDVTDKQADENLRSFRLAVLQFDDEETPISFADRLVVASFLGEIGRYLTSTSKSEQAVFELNQEIVNLQRKLVENASQMGLNRGGHELRELAFSLPQTSANLPIIEEAFREAARAFESLMVASSNDWVARHFLADTHRVLGGALDRHGKTVEAESEYRQAVALFEKHRAIYDKSPVSDFERAQSYLELAQLLARTDRISEAQPLHARGCGILEATLKRKPANSDANAFNGLAWRLATSPIEQFRDPAKAVELAQQAVELAPENGGIRNTLGVAQYRAGDWNAAVKELEKAVELEGDNSLDFFFLAMAQWQLGNLEEARTWYDKAVTWMEVKQPKNKELRRFRAESEELLKITDEKPAAKSPVEVK